MFKVFRLVLFVWSIAMIQTKPVVTLCSITARLKNYSNIIMHTIIRGCSRESRQRPLQDDNPLNTTAVSCSSTCMAIDTTLGSAKAVEDDENSDVKCAIFSCYAEQQCTPVASLTTPWTTRILVALAQLEMMNDVDNEHYVGLAFRTLPPGQSQLAYFVCVGQC